VYVPLPPVGNDPVNAAGVCPLQIACAAVTVLFAIAALTVICIAVAVFVHPPDVTVLLYQVVCVKAPGV
jgi:hypothetical protein